MAGGQTIITGCGILIAFMLLITVGRTFDDLWTLILGAIPLACLAVGALMTWIGINDLRSAKADAASAAGEPAGS